MAVTNEFSTQINNETAGTKNLTTDSSGQVSLERFDFVQGAAAGDATSTMDLVFIKPGRWRLYTQGSLYGTSAFGASRTLDIGWTAYEDFSGATVTADPNGIDNAADVSAATIYVPDGTGSTLDDLSIVFEGKTGVLIQATVAGGTIPAAATIEGSFFLVKE